MLKDYIAKYNIDENYNCAESMIRAANEYYKLGLGDRDMNMVAAYGGGIQCGSSCGAILGGCAALSMLFVESKAHESADIKPITNIFLEKCIKEFGSMRCDEIKPKYFDEKVRCYNVVLKAAELLEETINEYKK